MHLDCVCVCVWVTPGPRPELWSHTRGLRSATHYTDLTAAHLCACGVCWDSAVGLMVETIHLHEVPQGNLSVPARKLTSPPSYLQHSPMLDADWESLCPKLLLSQLIYIRWSDGVSGQSPSLEGHLSHLILLHTLHLSLFSVTPLSHLFARLLTH